MCPCPIRALKKSARLVNRYRTYLPTLNLLILRGSFAARQLARGWAISSWAIFAKCQRLFMCCVVLTAATSPMLRAMSTQCAMRKRLRPNSCLRTLKVWSGDMSKRPSARKALTPKPSVKHLLWRAFWRRFATENLREPLTCLSMKSPSFALCSLSLRNRSCTLAMWTKTARRPGTPIPNGLRKWPPPRIRAASWCRRRLKRKSRCWTPKRKRRNFWKLLALWKRGWRGLSVKGTRFWISSRSSLLAQRNRAPGRYGAARQRPMPQVKFILILKRASFALKRLDMMNSSNSMGNKVLKTQGKCVSKVRNTLSRTAT